MWMLALALGRQSDSVVAATAAAAIFTTTTTCSIGISEVSGSAAAVVADALVCSLARKRPENSPECWSAIMAQKEPLCSVPSSFTVVYSSGNGTNERGKRREIRRRIRIRRRKSRLLKLLQLDDNNGWKTPPSVDNFIWARNFTAQR